MNEKNEKNEKVLIFVNVFISTYLINLNLPFFEISKFLNQKL